MATNTQRITALEASVKALTTRVAALEVAAPTPTPPPVPEPPTPPVTLPPAGSVHGRDVTLAGTGPAAGGYALADVTSQARASQAPGGVFTGKRFRAGLVIDAPVKLIGCQVDGVLLNYPGGHYVELEWCHVEPAPPGDHAIGYDNFRAYRTRLLGCSDGARMNGGAKGSTLVECYVRCKSQSGSDHNDGTQNYAGSGTVTVERCNISVAGLSGANAALFSADNAKGHTVWRDNFLAGGGYVIRAYEDTSYEVTGNEVVDGSWTFGPAHVVNPNKRAFVQRDNWIVSAAGVRVRALSL